jgi:uncharacterized protein YbjT (DUF2867 family)
MTRTLTTLLGGTGFLGDAIARELTSAGAAVRITARHPARPAWATDAHDIELTTADIRDEAGLARALDGASAVVNAVSLYIESGGDTFDAVHVRGAARVGRAAHRAGLERLVLVSGIGVDPDSPSSYVRARTAGELAVREAFPEAIIVRPSVLFGPGDAFLSTLAEISRLPVIPLFGRGDTRLQPVLVDDVAKGIAQLLGGAGGEQRLFEFGGGEVCSYREIVEQVLGHLGRRRLLLPVPFPVWRFLAALLKPLPQPPLTRDQVILMEQDNVVSGRVGTFAELGIEPKALRDCLARCLGEGSRRR